jgi:diacylglycerol kinase family enzyme
MIVILNRAAGGPSDNTEENDRKLRELFYAAGIDAQIEHPDERRDLSTLVRQAAESSDEIVVAGGGDGTISAVAGALAGTGKTLGVLPLGTLNHFAKDLRLPRDLPAAIAVIAAGHTADVDVAEVNSRVFINNSSLGIYPQIVAHREAQQERLGRGKWHAFVWAMLRALRRFPFLNLRIIVNGQQLARTTAFLFVGNNEYEISGFNLGGRTCINRGRLGLYLAHRTGRFGLFRLGFNALLGRITQADDFDSFCVEEATIESRRPRLLVATDGEVGWMDTPLHYRARPAALRVLVPEATEAG